MSLESSERAAIDFSTRPERRGDPIPVGDLIQAFGITPGLHLPALALGWRWVTNMDPAYFSWEGLIRNGYARPGESQGIHYSLGIPYQQHHRPPGEYIVINPSTLEIVVPDLRSTTPILGPILDFGELEETNIRGFYRRDIERSYHYKLEDLTATAREGLIAREKAQEFWNKRLGVDTSPQKLVSKRRRSVRK